MTTTNKYNLTKEECELIKGYRRKKRLGLSSEITGAEKQAHHAYTLKSRKTRPLKWMYNSCKAKAKERGIEFAISYDYFYQLAVASVYCPVYGTELIYDVVSGEGARDNRASLDRIDNSKGYVRGNVWFLSWRANRMKSDFCLDDFRLIVLALEARRDLDAT